MDEKKYKIYVCLDCGAQYWPEDGLRASECECVDNTYWAWHGRTVAIRAKKRKERLKKWKGYITKEVTFKELPKRFQKKVEYESVVRTLIDGTNIPFDKVSVNSARNFDMSFDGGATLSITQNKDGTCMLKLRDARQISFEATKQIILALFTGTESIRLNAKSW